MAPPLPVHTEKMRGSKLCGVCSSRDTNAIGSGPTLMTSLNLNYFLTPHIAIPGVKTSMYEVGGTLTFSP